MKKYLSFLAFTAVLGTHSYAKEFYLAAGAGVQMGGLFSRYVLEGSGIQNNALVSARQTQDITQFNIGGFGFIDCTYWELSFFYQQGFNNYVERLNIVGSGENNVSLWGNSEGKGREEVWGFCLLGKYPFTINSRFTVFPLLGIEYQQALSEKRKPKGEYEYDRTTRETDKNHNLLDISVWNSFIIDIGGGVDFALTNRIFLRGELLCGFRLMTNYEKDGLEQIKDQILDPDPSLSGITTIPVFKISGGYKFIRR